ncbi:MAG: putative nucleotidyltransferase substrate binding domain-containing protein, partial [Solirubrobacterales bacterium]
DRGQSAALIRGADGALGIVTDRDLRARAVAKGLPAEAPVTAVTTVPAIAVGPDRPGTDVMLTMLEHDVHHVPVLSDTLELIGMIDSADMLAAERRGPLLLRRAIAESTSTAELEAAASTLRPTVVSMHRAGMSAPRIGKVISAIADALTRRAIELTQAKLGDPPAEFAWLALGSHGRREPMPSSDIDSGMAWRDRALEQPADEPVVGYMRAIASGVADCMSEVRWNLDPHGVTATGDFSASSSDQWAEAIHDWLERQTDERVGLAISITMDARVVHGPPDLDPRNFLWEERHRSRLIRSMLRSAIATRPPTGFLRDIVVEHGGEHRGTLDIKRGGIGPVVNMARVAALGAETRDTSTIDRLHAACDAGTLEEDEAGSLEHAYELFAELRLEHQVRQLERGEQPDDHLDPRTFEPLYRRYLRDAFREVAAIQRSMERKLDLARGRI